MSGEDPSVRERIGQKGADIRGQAGQLNKEVVQTARDVHSEAKDSIRDFDVDFETVTNGVRLRIHGKVSDLKSFQKEFENIIGSRNLSVTVETDFDVDVDGALVIELTSDNDSEEEGADSE